MRIGEYLKHNRFIIIAFFFSLAAIVSPQLTTAMDTVVHHRLIVSPPEGVTEDTDVLAMRSIINNYNNYSITPDTRVALHAPEVRLTPGFHAQSGSQVVMGVPVIFLNFVVLEQNADFPDHDGITSTCGQPDGCCPKRTGSYHCIVEEDIHFIVDSINEVLLSDEGKKIFDFRVGGITLYDELTFSDIYLSDLYDELIWVPQSSPTTYSSATIKTAYNSCSSGTLCNHDAINIYIFDNRFTGDSDNGRGHYNNGNPLNLVDSDRVRIDSSTGDIEFYARPFAHELGHAFRLAHVCEEGTTNTTIDSNLMASHTYCGILDDDPTDDDYCDTLADDRYGGREGGVAYISLHNCPVSSQQNYQSYGQIEVMYWHSMVIQDNLRPDFPF